MGWIRKRPDRPSPWRAGYRAPDGRERSKSFKRKVDAERWLRDQVGNVDRGSWVDPGAGKVTLAEVAEQWLAGRRARPSTIARDESILRYRILPALGPRAVGSLAPSDLEGWLSGLEDELAPSTVRKAWALAGSVLRLAVRDGLIARTPARDVELPALVAPEPRFITADQVLALTDAIGPQWRAVVLLGGLGGLRFGEIAGLQVADLDLLRRRVTIRRTASDVRGKAIVGPPRPARRCEPSRCLRWWPTRWQPGWRVSRRLRRSCSPIPRAGRSGAPAGSVECGTRRSKRRASTGSLPTICGIPTSPSSSTRASIRGRSPTVSATHR
jgi:hypothetical protein